MVNRCCAGRRPIRHIGYLNVVAATCNRDLLRQQLEEHVPDDAGPLLTQRVEVTWGGRSRAGLGVFNQLVYHATASAEIDALRERRAQLLLDAPNSAVDIVGQALAVATRRLERIEAQQAALHERLAGQRRMTV